MQLSLELADATNRVTTIPSDRKFNENLLFRAISTQKFLFLQFKRFVYVHSL